MFTACHISFVFALLRQLVADYRDWKGEGVWEGATFRGFSKNDYNPNEMSIRIDEEQVANAKILSISSDISHHHPTFLPACGRHLADLKVFTFPRNQRKILFPAISVCQPGSFCSPLPLFAFALPASAEDAGEQGKLLQDYESLLFSPFICCHQRA